MNYSNYLKLSHFGYAYLSLDYLNSHYKHLYKVEKEFKNQYHCFELISNRGYWFKVRIHFNDCKESNKQYYFSIYGENISCLALFNMHTKLSVISCDEFIRNLSSPYKEFYKNS